MPCDPVPIAPITTLFEGAILPPIPRAEEGIMEGITNMPVAAAAERLTNVLLEVFVDIDYII